MHCRHGAKISSSDRENLCLMWSNTGGSLGKESSQSLLLNNNSNNDNGLLSFAAIDFFFSLACFFSLGSLQGFNDLCFLNDSLDKVDVLSAFSTFFLLMGLSASASGTFSS